MTQEQCPYGTTLGWGVGTPLPEAPKCPDHGEPMTFVDGTRPDASAKPRSPEDAELVMLAPGQAIYRCTMPVSDAEQTRRKQNEEDSINREVERRLAEAAREAEIQRRVQEKAASSPISTP